MGTKITNIKQKKNKQYGLLSMMAMIVGIVIGSGIFVKNTDLISVTGSVSSVFWLWVLGAVLIISMVIAFLEIISITEASGDRSTLPNWGRILVNEKFGKFIGYYLTFIYFPILIASATRFGSKQFLDTVSVSTNMDMGLGPVGLSIIILIISVLFLIIIGTMNTLRNKPGRYLQNVGTCIKTIPLFFVIALFFFIVIFFFEDLNFDNKETLFQQNDTYNGVNSILLIFLALPSILFAFDGFLSAGSLSKEAKGKNTFKIAFVSSMIIVIIIYFIFSMATLGLGDPMTLKPGETFGSTNSDDYLKYGSIDNVLYTVFDGDQIVIAKILSPIISFIIIISILTNISGNFIASTRMLSDLSETNAIVETKYIETNQYGAPQNSGKRMISLTGGWLIILALFDAVILSLTFLLADADPDAIASINLGDSLIITGFVSNLIVIGVFAICAIIISSAILNRFKKGDEQIATKRNKFFIPASLIAVTIISITTAFSLFAAFVPITVFGNAPWDDTSTMIYVSQLVFTVFFFIYIGLISLFHFHKTKDAHIHYNK